MAAPPSAAIAITSRFDSGNIKVVSIEGSKAVLHVCRDPYTEGTDKTAHAMWFHFKVSNAKGKQLELNLANAGECSYPTAWPGYRACCSYDRKTWFRAPTTYENGQMVITLAAEQQNVWVAYFQPFSYEQHQDLIAECQLSQLASVRSLGHTLDGRELDLVTVGTGELKAWFIARQHPGESMAEWWAQGLLRRLIDPNDALSRKLRQKFTCYVIPNMNPDGSVRGHLRTNAGGANLNREWANSPDYIAPTLERSPEVYYTLQEMDKLGCDLFVDTHGDEELPHNFFAGAQGAPRWDDRHAKLLQVFGEAYVASNPDFQTKHNYSNCPKGMSKLTVASDQIGQRFDCLSTTLEQPFKDVYDNQEGRHGYTGARAERLGASMLDAVAAVQDMLRGPLEVDPASIPEWVKPGYKSPKPTQCSWEA